MNFIGRLQKLGREVKWPKTGALPPGRAAAVVAPLVIPSWESGLEEASLLYILRAGHLKKHAGQIAFPGGAAEQQDPDLLSTGFREGLEEVGLRREESKFLAELPLTYTPSGFVLKPFFVATTQLDFTAQEDEVEQFFFIPLGELLTCPVRYETREWQGNSYRVVYFDTKAACVWGITGRITELLLTQFFDWKKP